MAPFDRSYTSSYSPSIVTMAVSAAISHIFRLKEWPDLEMWVWGCSRSLKMARFDRMVSEHELKEMFSAIRHAAKSRCLIVGDFNYPNIDWDSWECSKDDDEFVDLIQDIFFVSACESCYQRQ